MSATPDNTLADLDQRIADLERQLAETRAERDEAQRQLAERTIERDEALDEQTAAAEVLQVINSSPGDLARVFDTILEKAMSLCEAAHGHIWTYDGESPRLVALRGDPQTVQWMQQFRPRAPGAPSSLPPMDRVVRGDRIVHVTDARQDDAYRSHPSYRDQVDACGIRTVLDVALRKDDTLLGVLAVYRQEVRPFTDKQIGLLQNFAAQAVVAMESARLLTETREALEQQTATAEVLQVINSSPGDLAPVFDAMLEKALRLCEGNFGALLTYDGEFFSLAAERGHQDFDRWLREAGAVRFRPQPGMATARIIDGERVVHIADIRNNEAYPGGELIQRGLVERGGFRTLLSVALHKDTTLLGAINVQRQEVRPFTDKQIALLQNFAAQAVIAMENARLLDELRQRTDEVAGLNRGLEARVAEQVEELGRVGRLKRFLAPQLAELIVSQGDEKILESHRRDIVVVFCDLRGYTAFTETAEPEEVLAFLREYHGALGPLVAQFEGTLDQFSGDGIMVFFNDPIPCPDPAERAVRMAMAMREAAGKLITVWRRHGCELGFGAGIAQGYATLGQIGFSERSGYTAIGTVCNLAARLCAEAKDGQILMSSRIAEAVVRLEDLGNLELKGLRRPVAAFNFVQSPSAPDACPNLTVVARGAGG